MRIRRQSPGVVAVICVTASAVLLAATVMAYGRRQVLDTGAFVDRAVSLVHQEPVRRQLAATLTRQAIESGSPDLVALRPLIEATLAQIIGSGTLDPVLRTAVAEAHRSVLTREGSPFVLSVSDALVLAQGVVAAVRPGTKLPDAEAVGQVRLADPGETTALRLADDVRWLGVVLPLLAVALLGVAIGLARDRRRAVTAAGLAIVAAGGVVTLAMAIGRRVVVGRFEGDAADVARASWNALLGDLGWWGLALVGAGALIAAAAASVLQGGDVGGALARLRALLLVTPPGRLGTVARVGRALAAIGGGVLAMVDPDATVRLVLLVVGAIAVMWGISELLRISAPAEDPHTQLGGPASLRRRAGRGVALIVGGLAGAGILALGTVALATRGGGSAPATGPATCNGHAELCDKRLDEVALVTSHNSMSIARSPGWFNAHHYNPVIDQLDGGVRGLLIDTWLGQETRRQGFGGTRMVQTDLAGKSREALVAEIGPEAVAAAERLSGRILYGESVANPRLYLCHALCEIGATDAVSEFARIRRWLDDHPDQVVVIVVQDESNVAQDVAAMEAAGLPERAWPARIAPGDALPTLRQMIDAGTTALVMHESPGDAGPSWYQSAYAVTQETNYAFPDVAAISSAESCAPNRGPSDAPLFLLNHWLAKQPVRASEAREVNTRAVLLARARRCAQVRRQPVNLVAVNFVEIGDTAEVVDELNGVATSRTP